MKIIQKSLGLIGSLKGEKWTYLMGWRFVTYFEDEKWVTFEIEPMYQRPCIVRVPDEMQWEKSAPAWAKEQREEIISRLQSVAWNRDLVWMDSIDFPFLKLPKGRGFQGNLECSPEGRRLEEQRLFHPKASKHFPKEKAKQNWYRLVRAYIATRQGDYYVSISQSSEGSVTKEIEWIAARANHNIQIHSY